MKSLRFRIVVTVIALLGALRFAHWGAPLTGDEAYTIRNYAHIPLSGIVTTYDAPNNHLLLSVILHFIDAVSPKELFYTLADIRLLQLPSIMASILSLVLVYVIAAELTSPLVATLAATAFGVSFWHLVYSHMLRGYSLSVFFNLINVWLVMQGLKRRIWPMLLLPFTLTAAHYLIPVNACYTLALAAWAAFILKSRDRAARTRLLAVFAAAFSAGAGFTYLTYRPVLKQLLEYARHAKLDSETSTVVNAGRWQDYFHVLGHGIAYPLFFGVLSAYGLAFILKRHGKWRRAGLLILSFIAVPPLFFMLQRTIPETRVYTSTLPFWAMAFAMGLYGAAVKARRSFQLSRRGFYSLALCFVTAILLLASGQIHDFILWNSGIDQRRTMAALAAETQDVDDFAVIATVGRDASLGDPLDWTYYGFASNIYPAYNLALEQDFPYLIRSKYFILALDEAAARAAMARSNVDPFLAKSFRLEQTIGKVMVFTVTLDKNVLSEYRSAAGSGKLPAQQRAQAYAGLGYDAIRSGQMPAAVAYLEKGKHLAPVDKKIRYLLGWAYYLSFNDSRASDELGWVVTHDTENIHAPLFYGDTLAGQQLFDEALRAYAFYDGADQRNGFWMLQPRVKKAQEAARHKFSASLRGDGSLESWGRIADSYFFIGSHERAAVIVKNVLRQKQVPVFQWDLAQIEDSLHHHAAAAKALREAIAAGAGIPFKINLAKELEIKQDFPEARSLVSDVLKIEPTNKLALSLESELKRL